MSRKLIKWSVIVLVLLIGVGGGTVAANNDNELSQLIYNSEISTGTDTETVEESNVDVDESVVENNDDEESIEDSVDEEVVIEELPKSGTSEVNNQLESTSDDLPSDAMVVTTFKQLKTAIESKGNGTGIFTYYLGADITGELGGIKVPAGYGFVLDGTDPTTGIRHTYTEYRSAAYTDTIYYNTNSRVTITLQNIDVFGNNYYGTICGVDGYTLDTVYDNVRYTGPQLTYSRYGTSTYRNSDIFIGSRDGHAPYSAIHELGEVGFVRFEGHNIVNHTSSPGYNLLNFRTQGTLTFAQDSTLDLELIGVMTSDGTTLKTVVFEENATVNITQPKASATGGLFRINGSGATFTMKPGSELNVDRTYTQNTNEPLIYGVLLADVSLNNAVINYNHDGNHEGNYLISTKYILLSNGSEINLGVKGNTLMPLIHTPAFGFLSNDTSINIDVGGSQSAYYIIETTATQLSGGNINISIGGNVTNAIFHSYNLTSLNSMNINIDVKGNVTTTLPMFYRSTGNFLLSDTELNVSVNDSKAPIITGATLTLKNSNVTYKVPNSITMKPLNFSDFAVMDYSILDYDVKTFSMATNVEIIPGSKNARLDMNGSTIRVHTGTMKHTLFERSQTIFADESRVELTVDENLTVSAMISTSHPSMGFGTTIDIDIKGDYTATTPMIGKEGISSANVAIASNTTVKVRVNNLKGPVLRSGGLYVISGSIIDIEVAGDASNPPLDFYRIGSVSDAEYRVVIKGNYTNSTPLIARTIGSDQNMTINDSKLTLHVEGTSNGRAFVTNNLTVKNSDVEIVFGKANISYDALGQMNRGDIQNSSFIMRVDSGTLGPLILLTGEGFSFNQGNTPEQNNLLLYGPTSSTLIKTPNKKVTISIAAQQFNTFSDGGSNSVYNLPTHHYKNADGKQAVFATSLNNFSTESATVLSNGFLTSADNPADTFTLDISKTKVLSAGRLDHEQEEITENAESIRGKTNPNGHVSYQYTSGGVSEVSDIYAGDDGTYDVEVLPVDGGKVTLKVMADYLYYGDTLIVTGSGSLRFGVMPSTISFDDLIIPTTATQFQRKVVAPEIEIIDDRSGDTNWKLELVLVENVHDPLGLRPDLENVLIYKDASGTRILKPGKSIEIARSDSSTDPNHMINWTEDTGLFLYITDPGSIYTGTNYEANLQWVLTDLGS